MKTALKTFSLLCIVTFFVACNQDDESTSYKITGEIISMILEVSEDIDTVEEGATNQDIAEPIDLSDAVLTISYETVDAEGNSETVTLYEETFTGSFEYESETLDPTEVKISLQVSEDTDPMEITTMIGTGHDVSVALIDYPSPRPDQFVLAGTSSQAMDSENKFVFSGDLGFLEENLAVDTTVLMYVQVFDDSGNSQWKDWGPVLVRNNSFLIEGVVEEPAVATVNIMGDSYYGSLSLVLEPEGRFEIAKLGNQTEVLAATSGSGYHAMLIESWQQNEEYIELVDAWTSELALSRNPPEPPILAESDTTKQNEQEESETTNEEVADEEEDAEEETESDTDTTQVANTVEPAEGCEEAVADESPQATPVSPTHRDTPKYVALQQQAREIRTKTLQTVFEESDDSLAQYLAMSLGPYTDDAERLAGWQSLVAKFDDDFVAARITPQIDFLNWAPIARANGAALIPGQRVPEFTLANAADEDLTLYDLLGEKDMVLIDFWASWCGPCIADFPELKKLYAAYEDEDFEIVGVSIDSKKEDWIEGLEEHKLPWTNLGELKDWEGPVATSFGVMGIPMGYLVDSQGCIYKKHVRPAALKEFLVNRYGMDESLVEPDPETEDTQGVSG
ncbi:MAG: TlpA disulfide reductase family protein [Gammaproteobacteria bacterium]|nr:TlpA disulfide reductase family protein [Gammaproteobacteria bacterium]